MEETSAVSSCIWNLTFLYRAILFTVSQCAVFKSLFYHLYIFISKLCFGISKTNISTYLDNNGKRCTSNMLMYFNLFFTRWPETLSDTKNNKPSQKKGAKVCGTCTHSNIIVQQLQWFLLMFSCFFYFIDTVSNSLACETGLSLFNYLRSLH